MSDFAIWAKYVGLISLIITSLVTMVRVGRIQGSTSARLDHMERDQQAIRDSQERCLAARQEEESGIHSRVTEVAKAVERIKGRMNGHGTA